MKGHVSGFTTSGNSRANPQGFRHAIAIAMVFGLSALSAAQSQIRIPRVDQFPKIDDQWMLLDWKSRTNSFLDFVLNPIATGDYKPLFWWDDTRIWQQKTTFGLPSYVGMTGQWGVFQNAHEGIVSMSTLLSGSLVGRNMTQVLLPGNNYPVDLVDMQTNYFSPQEGIFLDGIGSHSGQSFWYDIYPNILAGALVAKYPQNAELSSKWRSAALKWAQAIAVLSQQNAFEKQAINLETMIPTEGSHSEPDAAAGLAYLMFTAYHRFGDPETLAAAKTCLNWLEKRPAFWNPNYEMLTAYGALAAARSNAENGTRYNVGKLVNWCFDDSMVRGRSPSMPPEDHGDRYGVIYGTYGNRRVAGLVGAMHYTISQQTGPSGYGFGFDTLAYAWPLISAVRYEPRIARGIGKWLLYATDSVRLTYPDQLPSLNQTCYEWAANNSFSIPYEGLMERNYINGLPGPFAAGDPIRVGWGPLDLSVYSGAMAGVFGATLKPSGRAKVIRIDLNATDFHSGTAYPTELIYNPTPYRLILDLSRSDFATRRLYESTRHRWIDGTTVQIEPDQAVVVAHVPAGKAVSKVGRKLLAGNVVVDFYAYPD